MNIMILRCKSFVEIKSIPLAWYAVSFLSRIHWVLTCMTLVAISRKSAVHCQKSFRFKSLIGRVDAGISCVILWFHLAVFRAYATFKDTIKSSFDKLLTILSIIPGLIRLEQLLFRSERNHVKASSYVENFPIEYWGCSCETRSSTGADFAMLHEVEAQSIVRSCFALLMGLETKSSNILTLRRYTDLYICKAFSTTWTMVQVLVSKLSPISTYRSMVKPIKKPQDVFVKPKCCTSRRICATKSGVLFEVVGGSRTLPNMVSDVVDGSSFLPFFLSCKNTPRQPSRCTVP